MAETSDDSPDVEKLYEYGERLNDAKDKFQHASDYEAILKATEEGSVKVKQLAAQLVPKFFKYFPTLSDRALNRHLELCEDDELGVRVQAIRGLPLLCKENPEHLPRIVDALGLLLLPAGETVERDAVHKALMTLLRRDIKTSLTVLFKHVGNTDEPSTEEIIYEPSTVESIREKVLCFIRDKVFPIKAELLKPQEQMERHITDLVKKSLQDVTGAEFKLFMDFLGSLSLFGQNAPVERVQELVEIIEGQADLDAQLQVSDGDHIDRLISCLHMALPFFTRGASSNRFLNYLNKNIVPVFDKLPEERKVDLLKNLAECSPYVTPQDSRQLLPSVVQLLKKHMVRRKVEEINFTFIECLLYIFHHLAHKTPNATNSLCGYKIVTGQPSDRLGEDFSEYYKDFTERLRTIDDLTKAMVKKLNQGMTEHNKAMAAAKTDEEKDIIKRQKQNSTIGLQTCNNILALIQPLHSKSPSFIGDRKINLSWKEAAKPSVPAIAPVAGKKRAAAATNGSGTHIAKKGRGVGGLQNQLVNRALEGLYRGRGGRTSGRGRGWGGGRGRGGGFH
ncbi:apoptosis inhibitor 5-like protein API5 isoform X3 [Camellia sinensis]|uniref:apoptosis inhibitor 5-like protein API5 isoform X3 n=1 Tax=Camellia sinensis TaxID=4442 RepID=UPI001036AE61|nr:apoptosis inhibitor 5-like protein API5 isoform X3 [Camellia sinensis]